MFLSLLAAFASTAVAGEIQVQTASPVLVKVDGQVLEYPENSMTVTARQLAGGTHSVEVAKLSGQSLASVNVNVPVDHQVRLQFKGNQLTVLGSGPMAGAGGQVVVNSGVSGGSVVVNDGMGMSASMSVTIDDNTMSQLAALGYVDPMPGAAVSVTVNEGAAPAQGVVVTQPPPRAAAAPMGPAAFNKLRAAVADESFSDDQLALLRSAAAGNWFTCDQLGMLLDEFSFSDDRVEAARILRPRIVDPGNAYTLNEHLTFSEEKEKIQALFR